MNKDGTINQIKAAFGSPAISLNTTADSGRSASACYLIERGHHSRSGKWEVMGEFVAGSPWRDGRPVDDETMREEVKGYRRTWPAYFARVRCPNGEILSANSLVKLRWKDNDFLYGRPVENMEACDLRVENIAISGG